MNVQPSESSRDCAHFEYALAAGNYELRIMVEDCVGPWQGEALPRRLLFAGSEGPHKSSRFLNKTINVKDDELVITCGGRRYY